MAYETDHPNRNDDDFLRIEKMTPLAQTIVHCVVAIIVAHRIEPSALHIGDNPDHGIIDLGSFGRHFEEASFGDTRSAKQAASLATTIASVARMFQTKPLEEMSENVRSRAMRIIEDTKRAKERQEGAA